MGWVGGDFGPWINDPLSIDRNCTGKFFLNKKSSQHSWPTAIELQSSIFAWAGFFWPMKLRDFGRAPPTTFSHLRHLRPRSQLAAAISQFFFSRLVWLGVGWGADYGFLLLKNWWRENNLLSGQILEGNQGLFSKNCRGEYLIFNIKVGIGEPPPPHFATTAQWRSECALNHRNPGKITKNHAISGQFSSNARKFGPARFYTGNLVIHWDLFLALTAQICWNCTNKDILEQG